MSESSRAITGITAIAVGACAILVTAIATERMVSVAGAQLMASYDLASEGPQLASVGVIRSGLNPYSSEVFDDYPFVLTFYSPLYYYVVNLLAGPSNLAFVARATSLTCMIVAGLTPLLAAVGNPRSLTAAGLLTTGVFFLSWPVTINAAFAKNDSMALMFGALAVWSAWHIRSSSGTILSVALGLAAFMAKQSFVAPLLSIAIYLVIADRRRLPLFLYAAASLGLLTVVTCSVLFGTGFWVSLVAQRGHPVSFSTLTANIRAFGGQPLIALLLLTAAAAFTGLRWTRHQGAVATFTYAAVSSALLLVFVGKAGASTNYFMEPLLALCTAIVCCDAAAEKSKRYRMIGGTIAVLVAAAAAYDAVLVPPGRFNLAHASFNADRPRLVRERQSLIEEVGVHEPAILNLADPAHTFELPGRISLSDPYCQLLIYGAGGLSIEKLVAALERRQFDVVVATPGMLGWLSNEQNNLTALFEAVGKNYRITKRHAGIIVLVPCQNNGVE